MAATVSSSLKPGDTRKRVRIAHGEGRRPGLLGAGKGVVHREERRMPFMAYSPIGQGRLAGNATLAAVGRRHGVAPLQIAPAWGAAPPGCRRHPQGLDRRARAAKQASPRHCPLGRRPERAGCRLSAAAPQAAFVRVVGNASVARASPPAFRRSRKPSFPLLRGGVRQGRRTHWRIPSPAWSGRGGTLPTPPVPPPGRRQGTRRGRTPPAGRRSGRAGSTPCSRCIRPRRSPGRS
jgi:hypothetical protein